MLLEFFSIEKIDIIIWLNSIAYMSMIIHVTLIASQ